MGFLRQCWQETRYLALSRVLREVHRWLKKPGTPVFRPNLIKAPEKARVISLSPHPDDDILAVGGSLAGHILAGGNVVSIVLTDGVRGTGNTAPDPELLKQRKLETENAASVIGLKDLQFWNVPDGTLRPDHGIVSRLARIIQIERPDFIYVPFPVDYHFDHINSAKILIQAINLVTHSVRIRCYECILPLIPNRISDITTLIDIKREAVGCFTSQNEVSDYLHTVVEGLNRLRSHGLMNGTGYAEGLFETDQRFLSRLVKLQE